MDNNLLNGLPEKWLELLDSMPEIKEILIKDRKLNKYEIVSPYFFSYFSDDYKALREFFLCCSNGDKVFENFYELCGGSSEKLKELNHEDLEKLGREHLDSFNYLLEEADDLTYEIDEMTVSFLKEEEVADAYDEEDIENTEVERSCYQAVLHKMMPNYEENFLAALEEALYELTCDYNLVYYILWPITKNGEMKNPYKAYVELWKRNMKPVIIDEELLVIMER